MACHRVAMVGAPGVGKTALISQFQTSECINAYDRQRGMFDKYFIHIIRLERYFISIAEISQLRGNIGY